MKHLNRFLTLLFLSFSIAVFPLASGAQEEDDSGWSNVAELTFVATGGNAEAETLGFRYALTRSAGEGSFELEAGGLRAENTTISRLAVGDPGSFRVDETSDTRLTAESYHLRGRYDRTLTERLFWYAALGWDRNEFAGVADRFVASGGVGTVWFEDDDGHFRTDYGVTFTDQEDVVGGSDSFAGIRLGWNYGRRLTDTTTYGNVLVVDANADETSDYRADMVNSLAVAISERLALKVGVQMLYDNLPSLTEVPLVSPGGTPTGSTVLVPLDELDTVFNVALVVNF